MWTEAARSGRCCGDHEAERRRGIAWQRLPRRPDGASAPHTRRRPGKLYLTIPYIKHTMPLRTRTINSISTHHAPASFVKPTSQENLTTFRRRKIMRVNSTHTRDLTPISLVHRAPFNYIILFISFTLICLLPSAQSTPKMLRSNVHP